MGLRPELEGMRLLIDPAEDDRSVAGWGPRSSPGDWMVALALELCRQCGARGAAVATTRSGPALVPRLVRQACAREFRADVLIGLQGCAAVDPPSPLRFGFRWRQRLRARFLAEHLVRQLQAVRAELRHPGGVRTGAMAGIVAPRRTLALVMLAPVPPSAASGAEADPAAWAGAIANGLGSCRMAPAGTEDIVGAAAGWPGPTPADRPARAAGQPPGAAAPPAVPLVPGMRQSLVGAPLWLPRGFAPPQPLPTRPGAPSR